MKKFYHTLFVILLICDIKAQDNSRGIVDEGDNVPTGKAYAIVIGISKYKNIPQLNYAHKDAEAFARFFASKTGGSLPDSNIYLFREEQATRTRVWDAISVVKSKVVPNDRIYFYFAGHGDMEDLTQTDNGLLLMYESPNGNYFGPSSDVLQIRDLKLYLGSLTEKGVQVVFIVDACHSGNLKGGVKGLETTSAALLAEWNKEYKILSCQPKERSLESKHWGGGRGLFSLALEEGLKGLADEDGDKKITFRELNVYLSKEVHRNSEGSQIPLLYGDLSRVFVSVDSAELAILKTAKSRNYATLPVTAAKNLEANYRDSLEPGLRTIYDSLVKSIAAGRLVYPQKANAFELYQSFVTKQPKSPLIPEMRNTLASALTRKFDSIVAPIMRGETSLSSRKKCDTAAKELDACMKLLGTKHFMYNNILARKLYMDAMVETWGILEYDLNVGVNPQIEESIRKLEKSEELEPNVPYTLHALGSRYEKLAQYEKAKEKFRKFLDLRPNDESAKYSLGILHKKQKNYKQAAIVFEELIQQNPNDYSYYYNLYDVMFNEGNKAAALALAKRVKTKFGKEAEYEILALYYSQSNELDSAVRYYSLLKKLMNNNCNVCDNNIGYEYSMNKQFDKAKYYFNSMLKVDSLDPYANFNLAMIDAIHGDYRDAILKFVIPIETTVPGDGFQTHFEMYFNKRYHDTVSQEFKKFTNSVFYFGIQYMSYTYAMYCFLRDPELRDSIKVFDIIFNDLFNYKEYEMFTWYHYACYKSLKGEHIEALKALEKALQGGFGYYFMLKNDADLDAIRNTGDFRAWMRRYFPNESH